MVDVDRDGNEIEDGLYNINDFGPYARH